MDKHKLGIADTHNLIRKILRGLKRGLRGCDIKNRLEKYDVYMSDAAATARIRQMKDVSCNLSTYFYTLEAKQ